MTLWRVSKHASLDGGGGLRAPGRWHTRGHRIVYCAPNPAAALLEVLVHAEIDIEDIPVSLRYLEVDAPDSISMERAGAEALPGNWRLDQEITRAAGDEWLRSGRTALLRVPSVIVPATWNILINPRHPESAQIRIIRRHEHRVDPRLL
ncbi:MAG: RES family NAD+ phosphorylase [Bryobacterales bacterium]|nr:RES family NAD+ phosphorylase [Bryobacterales bacterium]